MWLEYGRFARLLAPVSLRVHLEAAQGGRELSSCGSIAAIPTNSNSSR